MRKLAVAAMLVFGLPISGAAASERHSCVPAHGFQTLLAVGRTRFFAPPAVHHRLLICRPGHPTVSLEGSALLSPDGSSGGAQIDRRRGRYVEVSYVLHDGNSDLHHELLIDAATYRFTDLAGGDSGYGLALSFSADGWAAAIDYTPTSFGAGPVRIPGQDGQLSVVADPGRARHLTIRGNTARWLDEPGSIARSLVLTIRPRYVTFPPDWQLSVRQLAHVPYEELRPG